MNGQLDATDRHQTVDLLGRLLKLHLEDDFSNGQAGAGKVGDKVERCHREQGDDLEPSRQAEGVFWVAGCRWPEGEVVVSLGRGVNNDILRVEEYPGISHDGRDGARASCGIGRIARVKILKMQFGKEKSEESMRGIVVWMEKGDAREI